jgi:hypothetical protein
MSEPMNWEIERRDEPPLIWIRVRGAFDVGQAGNVFGAIAEIKGSNAFIPILIDDREADLSALTPMDLMALGDLFMRNQAIFAYSKVAVLMNPGRDFDMATKFQTITENKFVSFSIFSSEEEALGWLEG